MKAIQSLKLASEKQITLGFVIVFRYLHYNFSNPQKFQLFIPFRDETNDVDLIKCGISSCVFSLKTKNVNITWLVTWKRELALRGLAYRNLSQNFVVRNLCLQPEKFYCTIFREKQRNTSNYLHENCCHVNWSVWICIHLRFFHRTSARPTCQKWNRHGGFRPRTSVTNIMIAAN